MNQASARRPAGSWPLISLVLANLVPLAGVYLWGWDLTDLLLLYWIENGVVGLYTVLTLIAARREGASPWSQLAAKTFAIPFFIFHYGIFWLVHGIFLVSFFTGGPPKFTDQPQSFFLSPIIVSWMRADVLVWPVAAIVVSHGVSFVSDFLAAGEHRTASVNGLMMQPYGRVLVLHITIVAGGFLALLLGPSLALLLLFVVVKIVVDVQAHLRTQRQVRSAQALSL